MVRITEKIMKFFQKKKSRIKSSESVWKKSINDKSSQKNYRFEIIQENPNQEKVIQLIQGKKKNSPKRIFSNYAPLPAIRSESESHSKKKPVLLRQRTYTVLNPVIVTGPDYFANSRKVYKTENLKHTKSLYKIRSAVDIDCPKNNNTVFWFPI